MSQIIEFATTHGVLILGILLTISEGLALIPALKSNSILTLVINGLKKAKEFLMGKQTPPAAPSA